MKAGPMLRGDRFHAWRLFLRVAAPPCGAGAMLRARFFVLLIVIACALCDIPSDIDVE